MGKSYNEIRTVTEDWGLDNRNGLPYSGSSVQSFIKRTLNGKGGDFYYDADTTKYLVFADQASRELYLTDREENANLLIGSFDAPANYSAEITMGTNSNNVILSGTKGNYIDFTFDVKSRTGSSTGESVVATYIFNNTGNIKKVTRVYDAGTNVHFLVDDYIDEGTNAVSVVITSRNTLVSAMAAVTFAVISLELTSSFNFTEPVKIGDYLEVPYSLSGAGVKYLEWYVDGLLLQDIDTISDIRVNRTKSIDIDSLSVGKHTVLFRAYITDSGSNYYSKTLYYDFVVAPADSIWQNTTTFALIGILLLAPITTTLSISVKQYETFNYLAGTFDSRSRSTTLTIKDNNTVVQSIATEPELIEELSYSPTTTGVHSLTFTAGEDTITLSANVSQSDININEVTDSLALKLSAKGRSNNEVNPGTWTYNNIETTFNNFTWNESCGWNNNTLIIPAGSSIDIDFAPLAGDAISTGKTIEIDYETSNITNDDASIINLVDDLTNAGIEITATSAKLQSSGGANVNTKYKDGDRVHLQLIINKTTGDNSRLIFIVNNGILERVSSFSGNDNFRVDDTLSIGSFGCTTKIHEIKVYNRALSIEEAFSNYAVQSDNFLNIANNNDILNDSTGEIDADKVNARVPIMVITGDMDPIFAATDKNTTVYVDVEYRNMQDASKNFTATHLRLRPQGTSSLGYPRKNLRLYTSSSYGCTMTDSDGNTITDGLYSFKDSALPVNCWTLKADYAESSGSHNTGIARIWNDLMYNAQIGNEFPLRTAAQNAAKTANYNYDVRTAIDGFPIVVFHRRTSESELVCLGQYNFNNDKSTEKVFGFTDIPGFNNENVQCFEFLANESPICLFDDISDFDSNWDDAFESRYPDTKTPNLTALKALATWINSCKTTDPIYDENENLLYANGQAKWNAEKADHFDIPKLAAYYVYLMRFGAVDQTVKNAMITTEDGVHWFFINYDNDSVLGIDNISTVLNMWDYTRSTQKTNGSYYFAGHNSVLWNCFEADPQCMSMVRTVDTALYSAGLTYSNLNKMFDEEQCDKWCERIYNDNGQYKYIKPYKENGSAVLYMLQGSRKSYRHWWLQHRMDMFDAMWATGAYRNRVVRFIAEGAPGGTFGVTGAWDTYFGYGINSVDQETDVYVPKNTKHEFTISRTLAIGDPISIYNANNASEIDLSDFAQYLTTLYINQAVGNEGRSCLKKLILGDGTTQNNVFTEIGGLSTITSLEEIDIRQFKAMTSIELSSLTNLHVLKAADSGLTSFAPAVGSTFTDVTLPNTILSISLDGVTLNSFTYSPTTTLSSVTLKGVQGSFDPKSFVNTWLNLLNNTQLSNASLTLTGINWTGVTAAQLIKIGKVGTKHLRGSVTLSSMSQSDYEQLVTLFGENAFAQNASFLIIASGGINVTLLNGASIVGGSSNRLIGTAFAIPEGVVKYGMMTGAYTPSASASKPTRLVDGLGRVYMTYNGVTVYEDTGEITTDSSYFETVSSSSYTYYFFAFVDDIYSSRIQLAVTRPTYNTVLISGENEMGSNGTYNYTLLYGTNSVNTSVTNVSWSITQSNLYSITSSDSSSATITAVNLTTALETCTLTATITYSNGAVKTYTKLILVGQTIPDSISITGSNITSNGLYRYTVNYIGSHTAPVTNCTWTVTQNEDNAISISRQNDYVLVLDVDKGNTTALTISLQCILTYPGNIRKIANANYSVSAFSAPTNTGWVDLALDDNTLWHIKKNGASDTNEYTPGKYYAWGESAGYADASARNTAKSRDDGFSLASYNISDGASLYVDWQYPERYYGSTCVTPSDILSLLDGVNITYTTINDVNGFKLAKKTNEYRYIFIPCGCYIGNTFDDSAKAYLWTNTVYDGDYAKALVIDGTGAEITASLLNVPRYYGLQTMSIIRRPLLIDLGLPSGTLWADSNYGALNVDDAGMYITHVGSSSRDYDYCIINSKGSGDGYIFSSGGAWDPLVGYYKNSLYRTPTSEEVLELFNNTDVVLDGSSYKLMKKSDHSVYIKIPKSGRKYCNSKYSNTNITTEWEDKALFWTSDGRKRTTGSGTSATSYYESIYGNISGNNTCAINYCLNNYGIPYRAVS